MKKITIYDYTGQPKIIEIETKRLLMINVTVQSGDEVLTAIYKDGSRKYFDSSDSRTINFYDGEDTYCTPKEIKAFLKERKA